MAEDERRYDSTAVCAASGLLRKTLEAWLLRRILPLGPGPGTGRSRSYSLLDVVRIVAAADLTRQSFGIGVAGQVIRRIDEQLLDPAKRYAMILAVSPVRASMPDRPEDEERCPGIWTGAYPKRMRDLDHVLDFSFPGGRPTSFTMMDVTAIASRTRAALEDRATAA